MARPTAISLGLLTLLMACGAPNKAGTDAAAPATGASQPAAACALPGNLSTVPSAGRAVFVLDTSGSMRGLGDGKADIFAGVKAAVTGYVAQRQPAVVELFTFNSGLKSKQTYRLPADAARWQADMRALSADGNNTHLYRSMNDALEPLQPSPDLLTTVFVLTDGIDNDPARQVTAAQALASFGARGPLDRLYYIALGTEIPQDALAAIAAQPYATGLTYPVGKLPNLAGSDYGARVTEVTQPGQVRVPYPDGTRVALSVPTLPGLTQVSLRHATVRDGHVSLRVLGEVPEGTPALLCPVGAPAAGGTPVTQNMLLRFHLAEVAGVKWLNPGADRTLRPGESVTLRYWVSPEMARSDLRASGFSTDPGQLHAELLHTPGSRLAAVRLTNVGLPAGETVDAQWLLHDGRSIPLADITGGAGRPVTALVPPAAPEASPGNGGGGDAGPTPPADRPTADSSQAQGLWPWLLLLALLGAGAWWALAGRRREHAGTHALIKERATLPAATPPKHVTVSRAEPTPPGPLAAAFGGDAPTIEGLEYSEDRRLCLFGSDGRMRTFDAPLSSAFDIGQVTGVPHLSGLRMERHREGLKLLRVPEDLEVSQGTRLLGPGDIVRPGTLLGVEMAESSRAKHPPLGELGGLGTPLDLSADGTLLKIQGRFAEHHLQLAGGVTDLGETLKAPALRGLRVTLLGGRVLIADIPARLSLHRPSLRGEPENREPLRPGTFLPQKTRVRFKGYED